MAASLVSQDIKITYYLRTGTSGNGNPIYTPRTLSRINTSAFGSNNDNLYAFADKFGKLFAQYVTGTDIQITKQFLLVDFP